MNVGDEYYVKHYSHPARLLAIGGYTRKPIGWGEEATRQRESRIFAEPHTNRSLTKPGNLMLRIDTKDEALIEAARSYTEADFIAGKPAPEGCWIMAASSKDIISEWEIHEFHEKRAAEKRAAEAKVRAHREEIVIPKVQSELNRLGLRNYVASYDTKVTLTLEEFLSLAARIPASDES